MKVYGVQKKQIKNGVHFLPYGGDLKIGRNKYSYTLPAGSVVMPERNVVYTTTFKGCFCWQYLPQKDFWIITMIGGAETKLKELDPDNLTNKCMFRMIVAEQEENRVHIFIPTHDGDTKTEWRYFTDFFTGIIRNCDIS